MSRKSQLSDQLENLFSDLSTPDPFSALATSQEPLVEGDLGSLEGTASLETPPSEPEGGVCEMPVPQVRETHVLEDDVLGSMPITLSPVPPPPDPVRDAVAVQGDSPTEAKGRQHRYQGLPDSAQRDDDLKPAASRASTTALDLRKTAQTAVDVIRNQQGFFSVALYLLDETGERATVIASSGDKGRHTVNNNQGVMVGDETIVGWVSAHGKARVAFGAGNSAKKPQPSLPSGVRSELAVPVAVGDELLGVLDLQSTEETAFDDDAVHSLQGMADVVAISLVNARKLSLAEGKARQAKIVSQVTNRVQCAANIDDALVLTLEELVRVYDLAQATAFLSTTSDLESAMKAPKISQTSVYGNA